METHSFLALAGFTLISSFTPGPNNLMLMASGANYGIMRTLPHFAGVIGGFTAMVVIVGVGLAGLFQTWPPSFVLLKVVSVLYTLWLAYRIVRASAPDPTAGTRRPMTFAQAVAFQWVNPKAWTMALTAITLYAADDRLASIVLVALVIGGFGIVSGGTWMAMGRSIGRWLATERRLTLFNWTMAILLLLSIVPAL